MHVHIQIKNNFNSLSMNFEEIWRNYLSKKNDITKHLYLLNE